MTARQQQALDLIDREGRVHARRLAGELGTTAQGAGRTLESLRRAGVLRMAVDGGRFGYERIPTRPTPTSSV